VNRKILGLVGALLLAALGTVMIVAYVNKADERALEGQQTVDVLVVNKVVPPGTPAEQLSDYVGTQAMVKQAVIESAVTDLDSLEGRVSAQTLLPGEQLAPSKFVDASAFRAGGAGVRIPKGLLQTTIRLDAERAVGGTLTPGAKVAVTASFEDKANWPPASSHMMLDNVLVTNVQFNQSTDSQAFQTKSEPSDDSEVTPGNAPTGQLLVTLALDAASTERVVFAAERGSLWLSIQPEGANTDGTKIVTRSDVQ
jgi:pilus assembly protein CpaB